MKTIRLNLTPVQIKLLREALMNAPVSFPLKEVELDLLRQLTGPTDRHYKCPECKCECWFCHKNQTLAELNQWKVIIDERIKDCRESNTISEGGPSNSPETDNNYRQKGVNK